MNDLSVIELVLLGTFNNNLPLEEEWITRIRPQDLTSLQRKPCNSLVQVRILIVLQKSNDKKASLGQE